MCAWRGRWTYLPVGSGSGLLSQGGSFVSLVDGAGNITVVIEKMAWAHSQCIRPSINEVRGVTSATLV